MSNRTVTTFSSLCIVSGPPLHYNRTRLIVNRSLKEGSLLKHTLLFSSALCLVLGLLCGIVLPISWDLPSTTVLSTPQSPTIHADSQQTIVGSTQPQTKLDARDSFSLLNTACLGVAALKDQNYACLATLVHPQKGLTFTPCSTVRPETDITLSASQIKELANSKTRYVWGEQSSSGSLIELTPAEYMKRFVFDRDYTQAPRIGVDQILFSGNALENLSQVYPGCRFVDFSFPAQSSDKGQGTDWSSLKLVFEPGQYQWQLVAIIHSEWTT